MPAVKKGAFSDTEISATGYAMIAVTSAFAIARIGIHFLAPRRLTIEDGLVFLAYASNLTMCSLYIALAPVQTKITAVRMGFMPPYATVKDDGKFVARRYFANLMIFFLILWTVKFAFLLLYRKLLSGLSNVYRWIWWGIFALCVATLAVSLGLYLTPCDDIKTLVHGGCNDMTVTEQLSSLLFSYGSDTFTNLLIMALPIRLTWNLQMARTKKIGVFFIFGAATLCIIVATVRAAQIVTNMRKYHLELDGTWLAIWGMAEASTAVIIGFAPGFAALIRVAVDDKSSELRAYGYGSRGYNKQGSSRNKQTSEAGHFEMGTFSRPKAACGDGDSSQENLAPGPKHDEITVTTTLVQSYGPRRL